MQATQQSVVTWKFEAIAERIGALAWLPPLISAGIDISFAFIGCCVPVPAIWVLAYAGHSYGIITWSFIRGLACLIITVVYVYKPITAACKKRDWEFLFNDIYNFGKFRMPKMLFFGILLEVFSYGYAGVLVLVPAMLLIFVGPAK